MNESQRKAVIVDPAGKRIDVVATTEHPDSHHGKPVWVDAEGVAYAEVNSQIPNPIYRIEEQ